MAESALDTAYRQLYDWYRANVGLLDRETVEDFPRPGSTLHLSPEARATARQLILEMPDPAKASTHEKVNVLSHVRSGRLEWAYAAPNGDRANGEIARDALEVASEPASASGSSPGSQSASAKSPDSLKRHLDAAVELREMGKREEARAAFRNTFADAEAIGESSVGAQALLALAKLELDDGRFDEARAVIEQTGAFVDQAKMTPQWKGAVRRAIDEIEEASSKQDRSAIPWNPEKFDLAFGAEAFVRIAGAAAGRANKKVSTTLMMICVIDQGTPVRDPQWAGDFMRAQIEPWVRPYHSMRGKYLEERKLHLNLSLDEARDMPQATFSTTGVQQLLERAEQIATETTGERRIHGRHLLAAFFALPRPAQGLKALKRLQDIGVNVDLITANLQTWLNDEGDDDEAWRRILLGDKPPVPVISGFKSDVAGGRDQLGITPDVTALATLIAARTVSPPLSIGLFGDWGSGKTFFMRQLRSTIKKFSEDAGDPNTRQRDQPFYKHIIQIEFNAWHYVEGNLWASLVEHILDNLVSRDQLDKDTVLETMQKHWIEQLKFTETAQTAADNKATQAEGKVKVADKAVADAREKAEEKSEKLKILKATDAARAFELSGASKAIAEALSPLNLKPISGAVNDLQASLREARSAVERGTAVFTPLLRAPDRVKRWVWLLIILVGGPLAAAVVSVFVTEFGDKVTAMAATAAPFLAAAAEWLRRQARWVAAQADKVEAAQKKFDDELANARGESAAKITAAEQERDLAVQELATARTNAVDAARNAQAAREALAEATPTRLLGRYVADRAASTDYRKHLGVLAVVRDDFERLSELIEAENWRLSPEGEGEQPRSARGQKRIETLDEEKKGETNRINRIVLYIDDLDRCPPAKVVDVLQAVHLLLAFPLFVVVVGVDARWIKRSLRTRYRELLRADLEDVADEFVRTFGSARSEDYLEKIFQIPLWLKPMDPADVRRMVRGLVGRSAKPAPLPKPDADGRSNAEANSDTVRPPASETPPPAADDQDPVEQSADPAPSGNGQPRDDKEPVQEPVIPNVASLEINDREHRAMNALAPLLGRSPRALKRFVNVYRLVKARLTPAAHEAFLQQSDGRLADFEVALFLLAVDTGLPAISRQVAEAVAGDPKHSGRFSSPPSLVGDGLKAWKTLEAWLETRVPGHVAALQRSPEWIHQFSRFSFQSEDSAATEGETEEKREPRQRSGKGRPPKTRQARSRPSH